MNSIRSSARIAPWLRGLLLALPLVCLNTGPVAAQEVTGALQGIVVSAESGPEAEVYVTLTGPNLQGSRETRSERHGVFQFVAVPSMPPAVAPSTRRTVPCCRWTATTSRS